MRVEKSGVRDEGKEYDSAHHKVQSVEQGGRREAADSCGCFGLSLRVVGTSSS